MNKKDIDNSTISMKSANVTIQIALKAHQQK